MIEDYLRFLIHISSILLKTLDLKPSIICTAKSIPEIIETFKDHRSIKKICSLRREECQFKFIL